MDTLSRVQHTLTPQLFQKKQDRYHEEIMEKEKNNNYDIILFIQVHDMSLKNLIKLKDMHSEARFVLYNWDLSKLMIIGNISLTSIKFSHSISRCGGL